MAKVLSVIALLNIRAEAKVLAGPLRKLFVVVLVLLLFIMEMLKPIMLMGGEQVFALSLQSRMQMN